MRWLALVIPGSVCSVLLALLGVNISASWQNFAAFFIAWTGGVSTVLITQWAKEA